ncbi:MAG: Eco57I restriction-modification methylase domain-containing protein, partial [Candidatus Heimdallarchaeota archaeon]
LSSKLIEYMSWSDDVMEEVYNKVVNTINNKMDIHIKHTIYDQYNCMEDKLEFFKKYLIPSQDEVKLFGEVFTPIPLIEEMLDKLPDDVWSNKNLKWLDPANGIGNFPIIIYQRLMKGLKDIIENEEDRKKHILENMLYMVDISSKNTFICMNIFDSNNEYNLNIYKGDFLTANIQEIFGVEKFDIIVGNPPYQPSGSAGGKSGGNQKKLWVDFVEKGLDLVNHNQFLVFVHPTSWRAGTKKIFKKIGNRLINGNFIFLEVNADENGHFKHSTRIDWYVWKNSSPNNHIVLKNKSSVIEIKNAFQSIIPSTADSTIWSILDKTIFSDLEKIKSEYSDERIKAPGNEIDNIYQWPFVVAAKNGVWFAEHQHNLQNIKKVFISTTTDGSGNIYLGKDTEGKFGIFANFAFIAKNETQVENFYTYLNSGLIRMIFKLFKFSRYISGAFVEKIPLPSLNIDEHWTVENIYTSFNLTTKEIQCIENAIQ